MISKDSPTTKEFVLVLLEHTKSRDFVSCSLSSIRTEENMEKIIRFVKDNPNCSITDIDAEIIELTVPKD